MKAVCRSPSRRERITTLFYRLVNSAVGWSWALNGLRLALGIILLPLVLRKLPSADLGMYYVFLSLTAVVPLVDFGFGPTIGRFVSYAMGGAATLQAQGVAKAEQANMPNYPLLWDLLFTTRALYRILTIVLLLVLVIWGTYVVELRIKETSVPMLTRLAWAFTLLSAVWDIYSNWWEIFLRGMNEVASAAKIGLLATLVRLSLAGLLLMLGAGLLSLPVASLIASFIQRQLAKGRCLRLLAGSEAPNVVNIKKYLRLLWPNSWRFGVQCLAGYLTTNANTLICLKVLGLDGNAKYGLSLQFLNIAAGMASVWMAVMWPAVGQLLAREDFAAIRSILKRRIFFQNFTFLCMATLLVTCGPAFLERLAVNKQLLTPLWLGLLAVYSFLDMQISTWGTLIVLGNRIPYLWFSVAGNLLSLAISLTLIRSTTLGLGALVLGPLVAGAVFNYWYWPLYAARTVKSTLFELLIPLRWRHPVSQ